MNAALATGVRRPAYKVYAYTPVLDSMNDIVSGKASQTPMDLTPYCSDLSWNPAQLDFTLEDPDQAFHPDHGASRRYLADKAIIRLKEGDSRVDEADWVWTFTGQIKGQTGWRVSRRSSALQTKVTVFSRDNTQGYKRRNITSRSYTVGTEIGVMLYDIAATYMGLTAGEIRVPPTLGLQLRHKVNQLSQVTPWDAVSAVLETVGRVPYFDGEGKLTSLNKNLIRPVDRPLPDWVRVYDYEIPARNQDCVNKVRVTFLDSALERVDSPYQKLGDAQVTSGFFSHGEKLQCWWSDDHTQRADGTHMLVKKSINSGILPVGSESYRVIDEFHGEIEVEVSSWIPILATLMLIEYLAAALIPDDVIVFNVGWGVSVGEGITISLGSLLQAQAMVVILLIMMSMGSAQYEVWGTPYDYAYLEKESTAIEEGLEYWEINEKQIKNDFIGSYDQADALAIIELTWEKSNSYPRRLLIDDDLSLEIGDIVSLPDGRKFLITDMHKQVKRGEISQLALDGFKVMAA